MSGLEILYLSELILLPIGLLALFAWWKPKRLPLIPLVCLVMNFVTFGMYLLYFEVRVMTLSVIFVQPAAVFVIALGLQTALQIYRPKKFR